jgi:hypothetical protein
VNEDGSFALNENRAASPAAYSSDRLVSGGVRSAGVVDAVALGCEGVADGVPLGCDALVEGFVLGCDGLVEGFAVPVLGEPVTGPRVERRVGVTSVAGEGASDSSAAAVPGSELLPFGVRLSDVGVCWVNLGRSPPRDTEGSPSRDAVGPSPCPGPAVSTWWFEGPPTTDATTA